MNKSKNKNYEHLTSVGRFMYSIGVINNDNKIRMLHPLGFVFGIIVFFFVVGTGIAKALKEDFFPEFRLW